MANLLLKKIRTHDPVQNICMLWTTLYYHDDYRNVEHPSRQWVALAIKLANCANMRFLIALTHTFFSSHSQYLPANERETRHASVRSGKTSVPCCLLTQNENNRGAPRVYIDCVSLHNHHISIPSHSKRTRPPNLIPRALIMGFG